MPSPADTEIVTYGSKKRRVRRPEEPEFPGCRPFRLTKEDIETFEGRIEYWDRDTETAWKVREPTSRTHEQPSQRLSALGQVIAAVRGAPIECYGSMDLIRRNRQGQKWRILQADQAAYLYPGRAHLPTAGLVIGEHDLPDVVVEVDHTTDVRRGKLGLYAGLARHLRRRGRARRARGRLPERRGHLRRPARMPRRGGLPRPAPRPAKLKRSWRRRPVDTSI